MDSKICILDPAVLARGGWLLENERWLCGVVDDVSVNDLNSKRLSSLRYEPTPYTVDEIMNKCFVFRHSLSVHTFVATVEFSKKS